jgi:glycosyltransferase involved in cell wall biosynthesis
VHVHWPHALYLGSLWRFPFAMAVLWLYRLLKNNIVWTVHELDFYETKAQWPDRVMRAFLLRHARAFFVHARSSEAELKRRFGLEGRTVLTYHPSYVGHYADAVGRDEARRRLGVAAAKKVFLFFGYVKPYKGVEDLIDAFKAVADPDAVLLVVGEPLDDAIKQSVEAAAAADPRIRTELRYVADDEIQVFFNAADIVVFPFRRTHTSGSIMLAMTFGKPMVAPAIASIPEYVDDEMAVLFDPERPGALRAALERAVARNLSAMGAAARARAAAFSWREMAERHAAAYRRICAPARPIAAAA